MTVQPIPPGTPTPTQYGTVRDVIEARLQELEAQPVPSVVVTGDVVVIEEP